jgi:hypothetical protein
VKKLVIGNQVKEIEGIPMKIHYVVIGLLVSTILLGCTQPTQDNLLSTDGNIISSEVDAGWITDSNENTNEMIATDQEVIENEVNPLDENETINIGEML